MQGTCFMRVCKDDRCPLVFHPGDSPLDKTVYIGNHVYRFDGLVGENSPIRALFIMSFRKIFAIKENVLEQNE